MCPKRKPRAMRALTLVELLVAISVLGFVAVLGWRGLDAIARARSALNAELEQTRGLQLAFAQMQADCSHAVEPDVLDGRPALAMTADRFTLARRLQPEAQAGMLQLVTYRVRAGVLARETSATSRDLVQIEPYWQLAAGESIQALPLQAGVQGMALRLWADDGRGWRSWQASTNAMSSRGAMMNPGAGTTARQTLWTGLEVSLQLVGQPVPLIKVFMLGAL